MTGGAHHLTVSLVGALVASSCLVEIADPVPIDPTGGGVPAGGAGGAVGVGGSGGDTGQGGGGGQGGDAGPCPGDMVHATDGATISFCIDATEVTRADYVAFLANVGGTVPVSEQPADCAFNTSLTHTPDGSCPDFTTSSELPVSCVDWCDAHAYCAWAGKRLCGALAGGPMAFDDMPTVGEWHFACTGGLMTVYPYGDTADPDACNIPGTSDRAEVGSFPDCEGGFDGLFDMQGNVAEYVDACQAGEMGLCSLRGGHTFGTATQWTCNNQDSDGPRNDPDTREYGFRCCRDAD
jgi:formylglycine-generating enzyme required for sulfatase activity